MKQELSTLQRETARLPRLGFVGTGWIGRNRMNALRTSGAGEVAAIVEPFPEARAAAAVDAPGAQTIETLEEMLTLDLDGIVIATPSALHVDQSIQALRAGAAVFCQKPLGRTAAENRAVIEAARAADRLLAVDLSYRFTTGMQWLNAAVSNDEIGDVFAIDLVFHNAYGPDKAWYRDPLLSGGGCVLDLGIHLVDLACWVLGTTDVSQVDSRLFSNGVPLPPNANVVEDYAVANLTFSTGTVARLACSWNLHAGQDAVIELTCYGTRGAATFRNVNGSFFDFTAELLTSTSRKTIVMPPDDWQGRAARSWAQRLASGEGFDPQIEELIGVADILDRVLGR